jgi:hypothetical protein
VSAPTLEAWAAGALGIEDPPSAEHRAGCSPCSATAAGLEDALGAWSEAVDADLRAHEARPELGTLLAKAAAARLDPVKKVAHGEKADQAGPDAAALGIRVVRSCAYCHDLVERKELVFCAACLAPHHRECFILHGQCSCLGCEEVLTVTPSRPNRPREIPRQEPRAWGWQPWAGIVLAGVAALGSAALAVSSYHSQSELRNLRAQVYELVRRGESEDATRQSEDLALEKQRRARVDEELAELKRLRKLRKDQPGHLRSQVRMPVQYLPELRVGMHVEDVRRVLGSPELTVAVNETKAWIYTSRGVRVSFDELDALEEALFVSSPVSKLGRGLDLLPQAWKAPKGLIGGKHSVYVMLELWGRPTHAVTDRGNQRFYFYESRNVMVEVSPSDGFRIQSYVLRRRPPRIVDGRLR